MGLRKLFVGTISLWFTSLALAGVVNVKTFSQWLPGSENHGSYQLEVFDYDDPEKTDTLGISLTVDPWNAEALGLYLDFGELTSNQPSISSVSTSPAVSTVSLYAINSDDHTCGPRGCNINGDVANDLSVEGFDWELIFTLGTSGFEGIQSFSWDVVGSGLSSSNLALAAIRAQNLCEPGATLSGVSDCDGSDKTYAFPDDGGGLNECLTPECLNITPTPLPAAAWLFLSALGGFAGIRAAYRRVN